jgi:TetR/AcrR family transcriptional regulator
MGRFDSAQRARILEAAIPVFAKQGLEGAAIREVAEASGVNSALLYYYFENKHTLFVEAVRYVIRGLLEFLSGRRREFADGRERVEFLVHGLLDYYEAHPGRMKLMALAVVRHADLVGEGIEWFIRERMLLPFQVMQEGQRRGELRPAHAMQVWWSILGTCLFTQQMKQAMAHIDPAVLPLPLPAPAESRDQIVKLVCEGLVTPAGGQRKRRKPRK